jgi:hypothetical protein
MSVQRCRSRKIPSHSFFSSGRLAHLCATTETAAPSSRSFARVGTMLSRLSGFGYDAAGNMTSNGSATYVYDDENGV